MEIAEEMQKLAGTAGRSAAPLGAESRKSFRKPVMDRRLLGFGKLVVLVSTVAVGATLYAKSSPAKSSPISSPTAKAPKAAPAVQATPGVQWLDDLETARRASVATGRPMLIVFGGQHCVFCKKLDKEVFTHPTLARYINAAFIPVHLDFEKNSRAAKILEVKSLPTSVILSSEADLLGSIEGFVATREFAEVLHKSIEFQRTLRDEKTVAVGAAR
jgi:thiol-disulfide isomerase/thioredoxin